MARKIFYNRRSRRRLVAATGLIVSAAMLFSVGVYAGKTFPYVFSASTYLNMEAAPVTLAATEF
ncbi:hypothetical protein [Parvibaculum lavamentivorans]|nr:hypothetical protein [Parvibaculum lavamentivorans]